MDILEKPIKGKNLITLVEVFFKKVIKKLNQVHSQDYIESELGDNISATAKYIKIVNGQHIETFLKRLISEGLGDANSYVGLKVEVVKNDKVYFGIVEIVQINTTNIILRPKEAFGEAISTPAIVRLYVAPLLTSNSEASIVYNSIVTSNSKYNFILGERNIHKGKDNVWILGKNNVSRENNQNSLIDGYNNDVNSYGNLVIGDNNKHTSQKGVTIGDNNANYRKYSYIFGKNNRGNGNAMIIGQYGESSPYVYDGTQLFVIGDGIHATTNFGNDGVPNLEQDNYSNIFSVFNDGSIYLPSFFRKNPFRGILIYYDDSNKTMYGSLIKRAKGAEDSNIGYIEEIPLYGHHLSVIIIATPSFYITTTTKGEAGSGSSKKVSYRTEPVKFCKNITFGWNNYAFSDDMDYIYEIYNLNTLESKIIKFEYGSVMFDDIRIIDNPDANNN